MPEPGGDVPTSEDGVAGREVSATGRRLSRPGLAALLIGSGGVLWRAVLVLAGAPPTNSDEATMGLAALHIATGVGHPVWFYGQAYMGTLEAYLAAPLVGLFGTGTAVLRLPVLVLYAVFLVLAFRLTKALYSPWLAVFVVGVLALGGDRVVKNQLITAGGYPEILPAAAVLMLLSVVLSTTGGRPRWRLVAFAGWGLTAGLCLWVDWLVLPYVGAAGLLLVVGCRRELWGRAGGLLAAGVLAGSAPLILYNLSAPAGQDSLSVYERISAAGSAGLGGRLYGGVFLGIPLASGFCAPSRCAPPVRAWGLAYVVLLVIALVLAVRAARRTTGAVRMRELGRLALLVAAALTLLAYVRSAGSAGSPIESARYLHCLLVSTPAMLWPLWRLAAEPRHWPRLSARIALVAVLACAVMATVALTIEVPRYRRLVTQQQELISALDRAGATRIYGEYWTCDRIVFATRERILCAVLADDLTPGFDRDPPYRAAVDAADRPAYVLPAGSPIDRTFVQHLAATGTTLTPIEAGGYHIYLPPGRLPAR